MSVISRTRHPRPLRARLTSRPAAAGLAGTLTNFAGNDLQWVMSLMAQYNAFPFSYTGGSHVTINWTGPRQMAFAAYWQNMLNKHELNTVTDITAVAPAGITARAAQARAARRAGQHHPDRVLRPAAGHRHHPHPAVPAQRGRGVEHLLPAANHLQQEQPLPADRRHRPVGAAGTEQRQRAALPDGRDRRAGHHRPAGRTVPAAAAVLGGIAN